MTLDPAVVRAMSARELRARELGFVFLPPSMLAPIGPPPLGYTWCEGCGAVCPYASWLDAREAGWWSGTGPGAAGWAVLCGPCHRDWSEGQAEPVPY